MRNILAMSILLLATGAVCADQYDAIYVSDPVVCERAKTESVRDVLFDLNAAAVSPRVGIWMGELDCVLNDVRMNPSNWGEVEEVYATARCDGPYRAFIDPVAITSDSSNINLVWGDQDGEPPASVEILSVLHGESTDAERDPESYAGVYTICEGLTAADFLFADATN
ncbi:hypothetical protein [Devosia rhizoryzae]|uniref:DUF3757 domain-containing protein n=1 Tax=Devosia rhizoryzae TaxID=2774137 RepID=A0ABX7CBT0_9HYPH|nr:hypothetical protein [Devosia rhizoryzae]QQR40644.1 hypothetical protein JI748_06500 [Devosia rhizoryzae]